MLPFVWIYTIASFFGFLWAGVRFLYWFKRNETTCTVVDKLDNSKSFALSGPVPVYRYSVKLNDAGAESDLLYGLSIKSKQSAPDIKKGDTVSVYVDNSKDCVIRVEDFKNIKKDFLRNLGLFAAGIAITVITFFVMAKFS